ncbi:MAG: hypothetical protein J6Y02_08210 [Pseudobutyrivibrio sp.]|nr:hypothetical protein [Pseudobutyrivibrio sp.]
MSTDEHTNRLSCFMVCPKRISVSTNPGALQHNKNITAIFKRKMHAHILNHLMFDASIYSTPKQLKAFRNKLRHPIIPEEFEPVEKEFRKTLRAMLRFLKSKL